MKKISLFLIAILVVIVIGVFSLIGLYNSLIQKDQGVKEQWAAVETQYQRRFDLVPNLVNSVKGIMNQEKAVFGKIAEARTRYAGTRSVEERVDAANKMESALARLLVIMENYPELKSNEAVQRLMVQLEGTENRISVERRRYNEQVKDFNTTVKRFPTNLIAPMLGFESKAYFQSVTEAKEAPKVEF
ncbi:MAG: LemA family protein [Actinobacteria bacterium]|nr:LemA family protein [Actinomycetota bacterium]